MSKERKIKPVNDNEEKRQNFARAKAKLKVAIKYGFYLEALSIEYSIIEDRLMAIFNHLQFLTPSLKFNNKCKPFALALYSRKNKKLFSNNKTPTLFNISNKILLLSALFDWSKEYNGDNLYLSTVAKVVERLNYEKLGFFFAKIDAWRDVRNEITHAMMNKNPIDYNEKVADAVAVGEELMKIIDNEERKIRDKKELLLKAFQKTRDVVI